MPILLKRKNGEITPFHNAEYNIFLRSISFPKAFWISAEKK